MMQSTLTRPRTALALALALVVVLAHLHAAAAFGFFDMFTGGNRQQQQQAQQQKRQQESKDEIASCTDYLCPPFPPAVSASPNAPQSAAAAAAAAKRVCVREPRDCPCPPLTTKCTHGDWYTCVSRAVVAAPEACAAHLAALNPRAGARSGARGDEL
ncbi:hypothetical protein H9P43_005414 [Blastocladiella emersonii ATCC 22665]|nr:hypothetical protein H9P43_005414 [Blastocladiella emersonii ATCC 22665]